SGRTVRGTPPESQARPRSPSLVSAGPSGRSRCQTAARYDPHFSSSSTPENSPRLLISHGDHEGRFARPQTADARCSLGLLRVSVGKKHPSCPPCETTRFGPQWLPSIECAPWQHPPSNDVSIRALPLPGGSPVICSSRIFL